MIGSGGVMCSSAAAIYRKYTRHFAADKGSVELQPLRADHPVGIGDEPGQSGGKGVQPFRMIEIDDREIAEEMLGDFAVMDQPLGPGLVSACGIELMIDLGIAIMPVVVWRVARDEIVDVAVRVDAAGPADRQSFEIAFCSELQCGREFGRLDTHVETALLGHGL